MMIFNIEFKKPTIYVCVYVVSLEIFRVKRSDPDPSVPSSNFNATQVGRRVFIPRPLYLILTLHSCVSRVLSNQR